MVEPLSQDLTLQVEVKVQVQVKVRVKVKVNDKDWESRNSSDPSGLTRSSTESQQALTEFTPAFYPTSATAEDCWTSTGHISAPVHGATKP